MAALRQGRNAADATAAHFRDSAASAVRACVDEIRLHQRTRSALAKNPRQQKCRRPFLHIERGAAQQIRETDIQGVAAAANGEGEAAVGIELHLKLGRPAFTADAGEHALHERFPAGNALVPAGIQFFRLTGGGAAFFLAFSASFCASCVPSTASSRFSLYVASSGPSL